MAEYLGIDGLRALVTYSGGRVYVANSSPSKQPFLGEAYLHSLTGRERDIQDIVFFVQMNATKNLHSAPMPQCMVAER